MRISIRPGERLDDLQLDGLHIIQKPGTFLFGTDSVLLAGFVNPGCKRVLDLGTGSGVLPLLIWGHLRPNYICGLEIQPAYADMAKRSIQLNELEEYIDIIEADYTLPGSIPHAGSYDTVVANPPYEAGGKTSSKPGSAIARHELSTTLEGMAGAASRALKQGGKLYMVHRPQRLAGIFAALRSHRLEPKLIQPVHPAADKPARMVLIRAVKDANEGLDMLPPRILYDNPT